MKHIVGVRHGGSCVVGLVLKVAAGDHWCSHWPAVITLQILLVKIGRAIWPLAALKNK